MASDAPQPDEAPEGTDFTAAAEERLDSARSRVPLWARTRFALVLLVVLLVHAGLIAAFLLRDRNTEMQVAASEETPVEVIVETPPEPPKPLPPAPPPPDKKPPPPPPPRPKEDLSPAYSAPRKENQETLKTDKLQEKTSVPKAPQPPQEGTPSPKAAAAPPKEAAPPSDAKEDTAAKEEDKTKPDAEALDKATPKSSKAPTPKPPKTKAAKASPKTNQKTKELFASLSGSDALPQMTFAKPSAKTKVYGGTEDVRWMSTVEGMLEEKVGKLPHTAHWQAGGHVAICFHVDGTGKVTIKDWCQKSGYPDIDQIAMRALVQASPFPPPPPGVEHGLVWVSQFDGQLPTAHVSKR